MFSLFKPNTLYTDEQIHQYTSDIKDLYEVLNSTANLPEREQLEYNLQVMILVQQRLLESR